MEHTASPGNVPVPPLSFPGGTGVRSGPEQSRARAAARGGASLDGEDRCETITRGRKESLSHLLHPLRSPNSPFFKGTGRPAPGLSISVIWNWYSGDGKVGRPVRKVSGIRCERKGQHIV